MVEPAQISHWHADLPPSARRPALDGEQSADVVIVGAGYTGLWTAYYLSEQSLDLSIVVVEANFVGFGASGRNGGWCSPSLAGIDSWIGTPETRDGGLALQNLMVDAVDEVGRVSQRENLDCDYAKDGQISVAITAAQEKRLRAEYAEYEEEGSGDHVRWLSAEETAQHIKMHGARAALYSADCAALHPAKLVTGLAKLLENRGVRIFEQSRVTDIAPGRIATPDGAVSAGRVVIATEAYSVQTPQLAKRLAPVHSQLIVTEPLSPEIWQEIGLKNRLLFNDGRALVTYGQRTADDRIAFGYRASYHYGSGIQDIFDPDDRSFDVIRDILVSFFPALENAAIDQCWGGALGIARDMKAFVHFDPSSGIGWAGGYTGNGVAASNLAGRTMADLLLDVPSERVATPWVTRSGDPLSAFRHWEPEPLRWIGVQGFRTMLGLTDWITNLSNRRASGR